MQELQLSKKVTYDAEYSHTCKLEWLDEQLAQSIIFDSSLYDWDFDPEHEEDTYAYIKDEVEDRFSRLGFGFAKDSVELTNIVDAVFAVMKKHYCEE